MIRALVTLLLLGADVSPWTNLAYRQVFNQLLTDGRYVEAEANARNVLAEDERRNGPESIETALALDMLTEAYFYGDYVRDPAAEQVGLRAVAIKEKVLGSGHPQVAVSLRLMGHLLAVKADYERARTFYERAVAIHEKTAGQDPRQEATATGNLGELLTKSGNFAEAQSAFERGLAIRAKYFPPETLNTAGMLSAYGVLLREMGEYEKARARFLSAEEIFEKKLGPDHVIITENLNEFGALLIKMGHPAEAKPLLERALAIEEKAYGPSHGDLAFVLNNLATACTGLGDYQAARPMYERAIAIATNVYGPDHPEVARILAGYADLLQRLGQNGLALKAALRTEEIGRDHLATTIRTVPERQALRYAATRARASDLLLHIAILDPTARRTVFDSLVRSRSLVFDEMAARRRLAAHSSDPEIVRLSEALTAARQQLSRLVVQGPDTFRSTVYATALTRARAEKDRAERALAERSIVFRQELARRTAGEREVAATLAPGDALVSFVRFGSDPAYAAFVRKAGAADPVLIPLGSARRIENLITALRREIETVSEAPGRADAIAETRYRNAGTALRQRIWDPLEPSLANVKRVFLTPDHALNLIDFAALPDQRGGYLIEHGPVLHYLSAERDLVEPRAGPGGSGLLAVGAPAFDRAARDQPYVSVANAAPVFRSSRTVCLDFQSLRFEPLPGSFREVRDISALWTKSGGGDVTEQTGERATGAAFLQDAPGKRVLHVAAHGFFLDQSCPSSGQATSENPLLLSGIALAGANRHHGDVQDGIVTAEEIAAMDLDGVEWAVLSACETGLGKLLAGEGVFGLRRAFQVAGARTVVTSLWPVNDESAREWMTALYRKRFVGRLDTAASVRAATLETLGHRRERNLSTHPFYWGGFIAVGDWR